MRAQRADGGSSIKQCQPRLVAVDTYFMIVGFRLYRGWLWFLIFRLFGGCGLPQSPAATAPSTGSLLVELSFCRDYLCFPEFSWCIAYRTPSVACGDSSLHRGPFGDIPGFCRSKKPPSWGRWMRAQRTDGGSSIKPCQPRLVAADTYFMIVGFRLYRDWLWFLIFRLFGDCRTPSVKMSDDILPAPPTGGAFWWNLVFVEIIYVFRNLVGALLDFLFNPTYTKIPPLLRGAGVHLGFRSRLV